MRDWYDNQKKPKGDWRKLLQEGIDKTPIKRDTLTTEEWRRLTKLDDILDTLSRGENVQIRQLKRRLTEGEYDEIEGDWEISEKQMIVRLNKASKQLIENVGKGKISTVQSKRI